MPVGLKDVARRAGVSIKTVSNVVNGYAHVRPDTRTRVNEAIDALGYRPNLTARGLRGGRTGVIALAVPDLTSPYFAEIAEGVIEAAEQLGWTVLIDQTDGRRERELLVLHGIRGHLIDGVVFSPLALGDEDLRTTRSRFPSSASANGCTPGRWTTSPSTTWPPPTRPRRIWSSAAAGASPRSEPKPRRSPRPPVCVSPATPEALNEAGLPADRGAWSSLRAVGAAHDGLLSSEAADRVRALAPTPSSASTTCSLSAPCTR